MFASRRKEPPPSAHAFNRLRDIANWNRVTTTTRYNDPTPFGEANAQTFRTAYDVIKGVPIRRTTALDRRTEMTYTARGQLETVKSLLANTTRLRYNDAGDAIAFIDALGNETAFGHDGAGRLTQFTDPLGFSTRAELNGIDQTTRITDALSQDTALAYDPAQRLASVTNARGNAIERYTYDAGDRLTRRTDALGKDTVYDYDSAGRLERMTDRTGRITRYTYDVQGRVIAIERPEGTQALTYDAVGRLTQIADETGSLRYEYDAADRVTAEVHTVGARTTRIEHTYDPLDRRTRRTVTSSSPDGNLGPDITDYGYDLDNRLTEVLYKGDGSRTDRTTYTWDADSRLTAKTLPNGITVNYTYDAASRLTALEYRKSDGTVIERLTYDFDAKGQIVARGSVNAVSQTETALTAEYDAADRMTSVTLAPGTPQARTYSLAYDADGNLTDKTHTADPADRTTFTWDSRQRLARLDAPGLTATFAYDVLGRRTERRITKAGEPARITQYVYDGAQAVGELRVAQGPITAQATSLITGLALDEALARVTRTGAGTPELRAFVTDHLGSVLAQAREDQSVATSFTYSAYGETAVAGEQPADSLGYTAREDDGTGLYFYRARYYDPVMKRFVQSDPIGLAGGINTYAYVEGNPVSLVDPLGLVMYRCIRPLKGHPGPDLRNGPDVWGNFSYHQYSCVRDPDPRGVGFICGGQGPATSSLGNFFYGPGKPTNPNQDYFHPAACEKTQDDNTCFEGCLLEEWSEPRPNYGWPTAGKDCKDYDNDVNATCRRRCGLK